MVTYNHIYKIWCPLLACRHTCRQNAVYIINQKQTKTSKQQQSPIHSVPCIREINKEYFFLLLNFSLHAGSDNESEQLKELNALLKEELTPIERVYVRKSIEQHKLGTNRVLLKQVR